MASVKESADINVNQVTEDSICYRTVGVRNFEVYTSNVKIKDDVSRIKSVREFIIPARKSSVSRNKGALVTTTSDAKVGVKCTKEPEGKPVYSGNQGFNIRRKALADTSNAQSSTSRNVTCVGSKPLLSVRSGSRPVNVSSRESSMGGMNTCKKNWRLSSY